MSKDLGIVTAYGYALSKGYQGTEEEFAEAQARLASAAADVGELKSAIIDIEHYNNRYLHGNPNALVRVVSPSNVQSYLSGEARTALISKLDSMIESVECINYDGAVTINFMRVTYYYDLIIIEFCFYDDITESHAQSSFTSYEKVRVQIVASALAAANYELYVGIQYSNKAIKVKFKPEIVLWAQSLADNELFEYNATGTPVDYSIDGFFPINVTNKAFNNDYPILSVYNKQKSLFILNNAIEAIKLEQGYIASPYRFKFNNGMLTINMVFCASNADNTIKSTDTTRVEISTSVTVTSSVGKLTIPVMRYGAKYADITINCAALDTVDLNVASSSVNGKKATITSSDDIYLEPQMSIVSRKYITRSTGIYATDANYMTYIIPLSVKSDRAIVSAKWGANSGIFLANENGIIQQAITPTESTSDILPVSVMVSGYRYLAISTYGSIVSGGIMVRNYDAEDAIRSISALRCSTPNKFHNIGTMHLTVSTDGTVYTGDCRAIGEYPRLNGELITTSFTHNGRIYTNNALLCVTKDGTRYYICEKESNPAGNTYHPLMWCEKDGVQSVVIDTDSDTPENATIASGDNYPDLSGIHWFERSNDRYYAQYDSITELSNGELLVFLVGGKVYDGVNTPISVLFKTISNRTVWVPKIITTNRTYTYNSSMYFVYGYPTKNNSIQVFRPRTQPTAECVLISEYGAGTPQYWKEQGKGKSGLGVVGKVWFSANGGQTFKKIFDYDEKINGDADDLSDNNWKWCQSYAGRMASHIHSCYYDSVNNMVWLTNGDGGETDSRNSLFYINISDLLSWNANNGSPVDVTDVHPAYKDKEPLAPFKQYIMGQNGRDLSLYANVIATNANLQSYCLFATNNMLLLGNDTARQLIFAVHNNYINRNRNTTSNEIFIDIAAEFDKDSPVLTIGGFPQQFYQGDNNKPILLLYSDKGLYGSWDGIEWQIITRSNMGRYIGFQSFVIEDTDGEIIIVNNSGGSSQTHTAYKLHGY